MSKHTPGRWEINDLDDGSAEIVVWDYDAEGEVEGSTIVVPALYYDDDKSIADAKLLVAAPDLLEALEAIVNACDATFDVVALDLDAARSAIARAKGESQ